MLSAKQLLALFLLVSIVQSEALGLSWPADSDWAAGNFSNTTSVGGVLQMNKGFYREYEPTNSTAAWWHFNEGAGSAVVDSSGNGNTGVLGNASLWTYPTWVVAGRFGNALNFNNGSQFVNVSYSASLNLTGNLTVEAWVNLNATQGPSAVVLGKNASYYLKAYPAGFWVNASGSFAGASSADDIRGTGWHFLAGTYDGSALRFYIDGALKAMTAASGPMTASANNTYIGSYTGGTSSTITTTTDFLNGTIDEIRLVGRTFSADEIAIDYAGYPRSASYLSATTAFNQTVVSVTAMITKTEYGWNGAAMNATNLTVEVSVNNGTTWRLASSNATLNTSADNGTSLSFRVNFTTNDTRLTASLNSIVLLPAFQNLPPNVTLAYPANGYSNTNDVGLTFNCSAADDAGLASISLWHNMTGFWQRNATSAVNGTFNAASFAVNGTFGNFTWNCMATDSAGQTSFAPSNFTFSLLSVQVLPSLGITFSPSATISVEQGTNGTVTATVTNAANAAASNVSLAFTDSACCSFSYSPLTLDVPQLGSQSFTIAVSALEGASPVQFSTVVTARSQEGAIASAPLTMNVLPKATPSPTPPLTPTPSPTPDPKVLAETAISEANSTILSVDIAIAAAERERKDVRLAVSRLAEARGLLKRAYSLMAGEAIDYQGAQKAAKDAVTRASEALAAIPAQGKSPLADIGVMLLIVGVVVVVGFLAYSAFFGPKRKVPVPSAYRPTQQQYYQYYRSYPYYYRPSQQQPPPQQQQPRKPY